MRQDEYISSNRQTDRVTTPIAEADFSVREFYDSGRVEIHSAVDPITLQADGARKKLFQQALGAAVDKATEGIFTHDVEITLVWLIEETRRYQTHLVADLDNVLKPILDAVTGPNGVLIDDNQVQSIQASWVTPGPRTGFELTLEALHPDEYVTRAGLSFIEFSADRCYMLYGSLGASGANAVVAAYRHMVNAYGVMRAQGIPEHAARSVLPAARPFPRARLGRFPLRRDLEFPGSLE